MNKNRYIINSQAITVLINNHAHRIEKTDPRYATVIKNLESPPDILNEIILNKKKKDDAVKAGFIIGPTEVTYKGEKLPNVLANKIRRIHSEGLPLALFEKFWENLQNNPSQTSVNELYDFLAYKELPLTERGTFIAYKGVENDYWSVKGNTETTVLQGKVDRNGRIYNGVGETIQVRRRDVDDNRNNTCSNGVHVGSLDYARNWASRVVMVEVNPAHVVSIPLDCQAQKCRVEQYTVIGDYVEEIVAPVVDENNQPIISSTHVEQKAATKERSGNTERVRLYLESKANNGVDYVTIRQIQSIFSPEWPTKVEIMDILQELEYSWNEDEYVNTGYNGDDSLDSDDWYDDGYTDEDDE